MSNHHLFQDLVDSLRQVLLTPSLAPLPSTPITSSISTSTSAPTIIASPMARPAPYSGSAEECNGFLLQCTLTFEMQPQLYPTDSAKIAFIISLSVRTCIAVGGDDLGPGQPRHSESAEFPCAFPRSVWEDGWIYLEPGQMEEPPLLLILDEGSVYKVKEFLQSWRRGGQLEYLVDWKGFGPKERSWVPRTDILDPALMSKFHAAHPDLLTPQGRVRPPQRWERAVEEGVL